MTRFALGVMWGCFGARGIDGICHGNQAAFFGKQGCQGQAPKPFLSGGASPVARFGWEE